LRSGQKKQHVNRYFRSDIPLVAPEDSKRELRSRESGFEKFRLSGVKRGKKQVKIFFDSSSYDLIRGKREFAYHVMALMVKKNYGDINAAMEEMIAVEAEWEHKPFLKEVDGEVRQVVPFSELTSKTFGDGFHSTPAEVVQAKEGENEKVAFEWSTNLY
jgi:hypothetical protein